MSSLRTAEEEDSYWEEVCGTGGLSCFVGIQNAGQMGGDTVGLQWKRENLSPMHRAEQCADFSLVTTPCCIIFEE